MLLRHVDSPSTWLFCTSGTRTKSRFRRLSGRCSLQQPTQHRVSGSVAFLWTRLMSASLRITHPGGGTGDFTRAFLEEAREATQRRLRVLAALVHNLALTQRLCTLPSRPPGSTSTRVTCASSGNAPDLSSTNGLPCCKGPPGVA